MKKTQTKKIVKSKEELLRELETKKEVARVRVIAKDKLLPLLLENTKSISEAQMVVSDIANTAEAYLYQISRNLEFSKLEMIERTSPTDPRADFYKKVVSLFYGETVETAMRLLNGMKDAIDVAMKEKTIKEHLSTIADRLFDETATS